MKKIKFTGKLSLNKETIAKLNDEQMSKVNGGDALSYNSRYCTEGNCTTTYCDSVISAGCPPKSIACI